MEHVFSIRNMAGEDTIGFKTWDEAYIELKRLAAGMPFGHVQGNFLFHTKTGDVLYKIASVPVRVPDKKLPVEVLKLPTAVIRVELTGVRWNHMMDHAVIEFTVLEIIRPTRESWPLVKGQEGEMPAPEFYDYVVAPWDVEALLNDPVQHVAQK